MARPRLDLSDPLLQDMPTGFETAVRIAARNAESEVNSVIDEYEAELNKAVEAFEKKDFTEEFKTAMDAELEAFEQDIGGLKAQAKKIDGALKAVKAAADAAGVQNKKLSDATAALEKEASALKGKITAMTEKFQALGGKLGNVAGVAVKSAAKSVLPFL